MSATPVRADDQSADTTPGGAGEADAAVAPHVSLAARALQVMGREGPVALLRKSAYWIPRLAANQFRTRLRRATSWNRAAGFWIEFAGNRGRTRGLQFDLDNPYISTALKSRFLFGTWEVTAARMVDRYLPADQPVIEFGGCIGGTSCLANRRLLRRDQHVVVEAHPGLIDTLRKNRDLNDCEFDVIHAALAYGAETVEFTISREICIGGRIGADGDGERVTVPTVTLRELLDRYGYEGVSLIVDIEGAEADLVENELPALARSVGTLFVEVHPWVIGQKGVERMLDRLQSAGFRQIARDGEDYVFRNMGSGVGGPDGARSSG